MAPAAFDQKRACMRWIYAQRRLGLPLSPYHVERIVDALEMQIDEVPDEIVDDTILTFGMSSFLICEDCGLRVYGRDHDLMLCAASSAAPKSSRDALVSGRKSTPFSSNSTAAISSG